MAKAASSSALAHDDKQPDFDGALSAIQKIMAVEESAKKKSGETKTHYETIDNFKVDRGAARQMKSILKLQPANRAVHLRSLFGLLIAGKDMIDLPGDLVDLMHKAIPEKLHVETPGSVEPKPKGTKDNVVQHPAAARSEGDEGDPAGDEDPETGNADDDEWNNAAPAGSTIPDVMDPPEGSA